MHKGPLRWHSPLSPARGPRYIYLCKKRKEPNEGRIGGSQETKSPLGDHGGMAVLGSERVCAEVVEMQGATQAPRASFPSGPPGQPLAHLLGLADHLAHHLFDVGLPVYGGLHVYTGPGHTAVGDGVRPAQVQLWNGTVRLLGPVLQ